MSALYTKFKCPVCKGIREIVRRSSSIGKMVPSYCSSCGKMTVVKVKAEKAGRNPMNKIKSGEKIILVRKGREILCKVSSIWQNANAMHQGDYFISVDVVERKEWLRN